MDILCGWLTDFLLNMDKLEKLFFLLNIYVNPIAPGK